MNQRDASEVVFGLILKGGDKNMVMADSLVGPYNVALKEDLRDISAIKAQYGFDAIRAAEYASEDVEISELASWAKTLTQLAVRAQVGKKLERIARKLQEGENDSHDSLLELAASLDRGETEFISMADVETPTDEEIWVPSFFEPIDANAGGFPNSGLTIISGPAALGKSTLLLQLLVEAGRNGKEAVLFSLEMSAPLVRKRLNDVAGPIAKRVLEKIYISDEVITSSEVYARAVRFAAEHKLHFIAIDYADKMVQGAQSEDSMGEVYNSMSTLARVTGVPVVLIAGVSRGYVGGEPMVNHIRYSGRAEHDASLIILIYNPGLLEVDMSSSNRHGLPYIPGSGWIKFGKSRIGMKKGTIGAAQVGWDGTRGRWREKTLEWYPKIIG